MPQTINDELIQERLAQLNAIVARRNEFLLELFRMMRTKRDINYTLSDTEDEEGDLEAFLQRFDLSKDPVAGSISNLEEDEILFTKQILQPEESPSATSNSKPVSSARTTRSRSRALEVIQSPPAPASLENTESESLVDIESPRRSEERQQSPPVSSPAHKSSPPISVVPQMVVNDEEDEDEDNDELDLLRSSDVAVVENRPSDNVAVDEHATTTTLDGDAEREKELPTVEPPVSSLLSIKGTVEVHTPTETRAAEPFESSSDPSPASPPSPLTTATIEEDNTLTPEPNQATEQMSVDTPDNQAESPPPPAEPVTSPVPEVKEEVIMEEVIEEQPQSENHETEMDESMQDVSMDLDSDDIKHDAPPSPSPVVVVDENIAQPALVPAPAPAPVIPYIPIHIPLPPSIQEKIFIPAPTSTTEEVHYNVDVESEIRKPPPESNNEDELHTNPQYPLPPLSILPADFTRKAKPIRRKKEKESKRDKEKDDAIPMGLARWGATAMANPVYTKVARATKCLNTREWGVAMAELRLIRTLDRIETLKDGGRWSFRQPKKQRGVGGLTKTHWDYLLDEMKWMRIDFREERRWKLALAYNLSTSVLEWHHAKTPEERLREGICVKWKVSQFKDNEPKNIEMNILSDNAMEINGMDVPEATQDATTSNPPIPKSALLGINYGSEDEEEDEDEKEKSSSNVVDSLAPSALIEDALNHSGDIQPKNEEVDDQTAITLLHQMPHNRETVEADNGDNAMTIDDLKGLKTSSNNPVLGDPKSSSQSTNGDAEPPNASTKLSPVELAPLRERIVYSLDDQLFMDIDTLTTQNTASGETKPTSESADLIDLASLFPELQPLTMLDVAPPVAPLEGKKKPEKKLDRDDPNKRIEDTTYTKLYPVGRFMYSKPTLIGPLQPSKRFRDGKWSPVEQVSIVPDPDFSVKISEDNTSELFDGKPPPNFLMAGFKDRDGRKAKLAETLWSPADDTLMKSLVDKYSTNWALIAECFNSSRLTTVIDRRTPTDLYDRWKDKFGAADRKQLHAEPSQSAVDDASASTSANQMTTRGVKRLASTSVSNTNPQGPTTTESRKRRKHALLQESVRKAAKKRAETAQKMLANQRKAPAIHETHNQFNNLPKFSPQELSRMKAEKDIRDGAADAIARKRQDEQVRQTLLMREQAQRTGALPVQAQAQQQQQQPQQQAQQGQPQPQQQPQQPTGLQTPQSLQQPPPTATQVQQQHLAQLQQLQQIQAQAQAHQAALQRANGNAPAAALTNRPGRLSAVPTARTVSQQQATLLQHARAMQIPVQANGQTNLPQALLTHTQLPGNAAVHAPGPPFYSLPNLTQEQIEMFQTQLMNAQQQQQQQQQQHQHQSETNTTNFPAQSQQ